MLSARARAISTTGPAAIRIRKSSENIPDTPEKPLSSKDSAAYEAADQEKDGEADKKSQDAESSSSDAAAPDTSAAQKGASTSPFGFSSAGSGMASGILGQEGSSEHEAADAGEHQSQQRDSTTAAEARRARRQRAELPPLEDEPSVKAAKYIGTGLVFGLLLGGAGYYGRPFTKDEVEKGLRDDPEKNALQQLWHRANIRVGEAFSFLSEPATEKLLPDPNEYTMPYTLVLCLDDMLIHMDWTKEYGWRIAKRPGLDHFLAYMASMFEVVIFSTQPSHSGMLVMERLDPMEYAPYRLYKDHMRNIDGKNYKDLSTINRDMSKVIMVDISEEAFTMQPDNGILARPFHGEPGDNWIEQITEFLEYIHMMEPKDVRPWIRTYKGMDAAREFVRWEDSIRDKLREEWDEKRKNAGSWKSLVFGGAPADTENPPKPEFDQMREMMRSNFEVQHKEVLAMIEKERQENEEEMRRQMKDMTIWKMMSQTFGGADASAQQQQQQQQQQQK
ncbi:mitochondrial inner membrane protein required for protein import [Coemansia erecta]|uniref:Mitochondrial import inner membrane translocase subunit TIM50 n=1 Tax=Coemansia asiatica TaxID=1052880 RepID=A0A9W7XEZ7_9FUNG|nr:mitochondrial inner membrane protein required for protein import [Coemansia asiatica]KAJ2855626.1 mitochondrial inner membrane protein required for protein import [Coemansia erecta]KAJ2888049.1 mitochondrial inner membrane protein required for protein import [Coemansia asiatica]